MADKIEKIIADTFLQMAEGLETGNFGKKPRIALTGMGSEPVHFGHIVRQIHIHYRVAAVIAQKRVYFFKMNSFGFHFSTSPLISTYYHGCLKKSMVFDNHSTSIRISIPLM